MYKRPPFYDSYLLKKESLGAVNFVVTPEDLKTQSFKEVNQLKGYYTLAVRTSKSQILNITWNNKEDLDYVELTPSVPITFQNLAHKKTYFSFYAGEDSPAQKTGSIRVYIQADVKGTLYILKNQEGELDAPSEERYSWKTSLAKRGGISMLEILPTDEDYCINCIYIGFFECSDYTKFSILADVEHQNIPIFL